MEQPRLRLIGLDRLVESGSSRTRELIPDGPYTPDSLVEVLKDGWVQYWECRKCGWFETCPYPRHTRSADLQCGVILAAMRNFARAWWKRMLRMSRDDRSAFFDAFFYFTQYAIDVYIGMGTLANDLDVGSRGKEMTLGITTAVLYTRPTMNEYARALRKLSVKEAVQGIVAFVEGESEAAFVRRLRELRFILSPVEVHPLRGKTVAKASHLLLPFLKQLGYVVNLQVDRDAAQRRPLVKLEEDIRDAGGSVFVFSRDFESSFPAPLLRAALADCGHDVDLAWLEKLLKQPSAGPILNHVEQKTGNRVNKVCLAQRLAEYVCGNWSRLYRDYRRSEITRWVSSLRFGSTARRIKTPTRTKRQAHSVEAREVPTQSADLPHNWSRAK